MSNSVLYEYEGEMLSIKTIAGRVELSPSTIYKYLNKGYSLVQAVEIGKEQSLKTFKNRTKTNNRQVKKYLYNGIDMTIEEISKLSGVSKDSLYRRISEGLTPEKAIAEIKKNIAHKYPYLGGLYSKWQLERLTGVSKWYLDKHLSDNRKYTEEEIKIIIDSYKQKQVCMYQGLSLYQYCVQNGYNYNVIYYNMKAYKLTPGEAIKQYLTSGQLARFRHRYVLGDVLLYHFLLKFQLDDRYITDRIRKGRTEEEAIVDAIFLNQESYKNRKIRNKLRSIYGEIETLEEVEKIKTIYALAPEDIEFLNNKDKRVKEILTQYRLFGVLSLMHAASSTQELEKIMVENGIEATDMDKLHQDLLEGFVKREKNDNNDQVKYIWRKEN